MSIHARFFDFVGTRDNGTDLQKAYRSYKDASFALNGKLKAGVALDGNEYAMDSNLRKIICARSSLDITLYRMTSRHEFIGSVLEVLEQSPFCYRAYMSTSGDHGKIHSFTPEYDPLVLEVKIPAGMTFALLEANQGANEDEYLLGYGTKFQLGKPERINDRAQASKYTGLKPYQGVLTYMPIIVVADPPYAVNAESIFTFEPSS